MFRLLTRSSDGFARRSSSFRTQRLAILTILTFVCSNKQLCSRTFKWSLLRMLNQLDCWSGRESKTVRCGPMTANAHRTSDIRRQSAIRHQLLHRLAGGVGVRRDMSPGSWVVLTSFPMGARKGSRPEVLRFRLPFSSYGVVILGL